MSAVGPEGSGEGPDNRPERTDSDALPRDDLYHILQNRRRRQVLRNLQDVEGRVDMRGLAEEVAAWEHETTVDALSSDERQRVYISLYQCHLPKLDEHGIVAYDQSRGVVEPADRLDEFEPYLAIDRQEDDGGRGFTERVDSTAYYAGATLVGALLTAGSFAGMTPTALSGYLAALITGMFAFVTLGVAFHGREV